MSSATLVDALKQLHFFNERFPEKIELEENGESVICQDGIAKQEEIAQLNFDKWQSSVNPMPESARTSSKHAVNPSVKIAFCFLAQTRTCCHL